HMLVEQGGFLVGADLGGATAAAAGDVGAHTAGVDTADVHVAASHLHPQGLGVAAHCELGGIVVALGGHPDHAEDGGNIDQVTLRCSLQQRQAGHCALHYVPENDPHQPLPVVVVTLIDPGAVG